MTEELVITDSAPFKVERGLVKEGGWRTGILGPEPPKVTGATLTLTFPSVTDREHWIETHGAALARFLPPEEG